MSRSYYSGDITEFLEDPTYLILGKLTRNNQIEEQQRNAWIGEIEILEKRN